MSKLLKEAQIRRMMKLASIGTLSENFVSALEEEEVDEGMGMYKRDDEMEEGMGGAYGGRDAEEHMMEEEEMDAMDDDKGMEADKEEVAMDIITAIADKLSDEFDLDIDVSADAEPADDMDDMGGMGDEPMDEPMGDEPMDDMEAEADEMMEEDEVLEGVDVVEEEELVAEVLKRVTARLRTALKESKKATK